jgi:hypothetical protein
VDLCDVAEQIEICSVGKSAELRNAIVAEQLPVFKIVRADTPGVFSSYN